MRQIPEGFARFRDRPPALALAAMVLMIACPAVVCAQGLGLAHRNVEAPLDEAQRIEGAAILALADAAMVGKPVPLDFRIQWRADFLKAQQGTFVPFVLTIDGANMTSVPALLYVRAVPRGTPAPRRASKEPKDRKGKDTARQGGNTSEPLYPVDVIFPVELLSDGGRPARVIRGFSVPPGEYDLYLVLRERPGFGATPQAAAKAAVVKQPLSVPNFWTDELATSSVILADRLTLLTEPPTPEQLLERPYVIGLNDVEPAADSRFRKDEELICVLLVYNPKVRPDRNFDLQVEYHFFRKAGAATAANGTSAGARTPGEHPPEREGETYVNHTEPQRFNTALMGAQFDPSAGQPIMAGQGVPLAGFQEGDYRLMIKVTDLVSGKTLMRDVNFTVGSGRSLD